jgi:hypothetical protein
MTREAGSGKGKGGGESASESENRMKAAERGGGEEWSVTKSVMNVVN